ncbi:TPA: peptidase, partial [Neisseria meningitidis]
MIEMSKDYRNDLYDVYVSYPPKVDCGLIRECLRENLGEEKAEGLIESLDSKPQVLVEEKCTWEKRAELHDYFSYLGLDIITRRYMELETVVPPE